GKQAVWHTDTGPLSGFDKDKFSGRRKNGPFNTLQRPANRRGSCRNGHARCEKRPDKDRLGFHKLYCLAYCYYCAERFNHTGIGKTNAFEVPGQRMKFTVLGSGSTGNAVLISSETTNVLVDAGLSAREILRRLADVGVDSADLDAVLITHEHS